MPAEPAEEGRGGYSITCGKRVNVFDDLTINLNLLAK